MQPRFAFSVAIIFGVFQAVAQLPVPTRLEGQPESRSPGWTLADFSLDLRASLAPANHLWVMSGQSTVNPTEATVLGVGECHSPPFGGRDFKLTVTLRVNDHEIKDVGSTGKGDVGLLYAGGTWRPDKITRHGTYHHQINGRLLSFQITGELVPLVNRAGFLVKATLQNRTAEKMRVQLLPTVTPGSPNVIPLNGWKFSLPPKGKPAGPVSDTRWANDKASITLLEETPELTIDPGEGKTAYLAVVFAESSQTTAAPDHLRDWENEAVLAWQNRLRWALQHVPVLETTIPGLRDYYHRSVASGLVCLWENPLFTVNPFLSTLGMDGGGICAYLWDVGGYVPHVSALILQDKVVNVAKTMASIGLDKYYAYTLDGSGIGVPYAYSTWAYVNFVWSISRQRGIDRALFETAIKLVMAQEDRPKKNELIDYGVQLNLLEMRGIGWEHYVASPNAERAWCLDRLADMGEALGYPQPQTKDWRERAGLIRTAVRQQLWDERAQWFRSQYPDGHQELTYSVQAYDALRAGVCTPEMTDALLSHLREGAFLSAYGVSSVSAEDSLHYEVNDTDWSGGGAYTGDGPQLALILYEQRRPALAWDVLKRHFWMGQHLPYYPQEHYVDRPAVPAHKRANEVAGLAGAETILYGLAGFDPRIDGSLWIHPQPPAEGSITLRGYRVKNHWIDVSLRANACEIRLDGKRVYRGKPKLIKLLD